MWRWFPGYSKRRGNPNPARWDPNSLSWKRQFVDFEEAYNLWDKIPVR